MKLPWPEISSRLRPDESIRQILDYLAWVGLEMAQHGYLAGAEREGWRQRIQAAYRALFLPPVAGHGDPYPPDVPPARNPGIWPDIPSSGVPGMTVRHQLKVIRLLALDLRDHPWPHGREPQFLEWDRRLSQAREAVDLGPGVPLPDEAKTSASEKVLAEAKAQADAKRNLQRKRERAMKRLKAQARAKKSPAPKKKADAKAKPATKAKATKKKAAAAVKKPTTKKAPARKSPPRAKKAAKKTVTKKTVVKKKVTKKKAVKKKVVGKKPVKGAAAKKTPKKKAAPRKKPSAKK